MKRVALVVVILGLVLATGDAAVGQIRGGGLPVQAALRLYTPPLGAPTHHGFFWAGARR